jgi:hypothetical protein
MPDCARTSFTNIIYTKLATFPSSKISQIIHPVPSLPQGILRTMGGMHSFQTPSNKISNMSSAPAELI